MTQGSHDPTLGARDATACSPSDLFDLLWATLVDIVGSPTTAALMRRSVRHQMAHYRELEELAITRQGFEYAYVVPAAWKHANGQSMTALQALVQSLSGFLVELTGPIVVRRLKELPQLAECGVIVSEEKPL